MASSPVFTASTEYPSCWRRPTVPEMGCGLVSTRRIEDRGVMSKEVFILSSWAKVIPGASSKNSQNISWCSYWKTKRILWSKILSASYSMPAFMFPFRYTKNSIGYNNWLWGQQPIWDKTDRWEKYGALSGWRILGARKQTPSRSVISKRFMRFSLFVKATIIPDSSQSNLWTNGLFLHVIIWLHLASYRPP